MKKLTLIIPAREELESIPKVLKFAQVACKYVEEILVVIDDLSDSTFQLNVDEVKISADIRLIQNQSFGVAGAIGTGVKNSKNEFLLVCMADEVLPLIRLDDFFNALNTDFSFVTATRYSGGGKRYGGSLKGKLLSRSANLIFKTIYPGIGITDWTTGVKAFKKKDWTMFSENFNGKGWSIALHMSNVARKNKLTVKEIPIISVDRTLGGVSKFKAFSWAISYINVYIKSVLTKTGR